MADLLFDTISFQPLRLAGDPSLSGLAGGNPSLTSRPDLLTRARAAAYIGKSESWLAHNLDDGPTITRIGGSVRYLVADLDAWLLSCRQTSRPAPAKAPAPNSSEVVATAAARIRTAALKDKQD